MISIIVAMTENRVIGLQGAMPWHLPDDLKRFKSLTTGHPIIMGRKTYASIGKPLPQRTNIVLTRSALDDEGIQTARDLQHALELAANNDETFIIGGGEIYQLALPHTQRCYVTQIHATLEGDTIFPPLGPNQWQLISDEYHPSDDRHAYAFTFQLFERLGQ